MTVLEFNENLDAYTYKHAEEATYDYHTNTFDFPLVHTHKDYWEFTILTDGKILHTINGKKEIYDENTMFVSSPSDVHCFKKHNCEKVRYMNISVRSSRMDEMSKFLSIDLKTILDKKKTYYLPEDLIYHIEEIFYKINLLSIKEIRTRNLLLESAFLQVIQRISLSNINVLGENLNGDFVWMHKLSSLLQRRDFPSYTVKDLCEELGYSRMQLNRIFKSHLNKTPHEYLSDYKLRYARSLLRSTDMKILEVAMTAGYSTLSQFQASFKKKFGITPSQFRKESKPID